MIVEKKVELPSHVWQAILEHTPAETMPVFDKKLKDVGPPTPSKLEAMELRVSEQHALQERMSAVLGETSGGR